MQNIYQSVLCSTYLGLEGKKGYQEISRIKRAVVDTTGKLVNLPFDL